MKALLPLAMVLAVAAAAAAAWFAPVRAEIQTRPARVDEAGQPMTAKPLTSLTPADREEAERLLKKADELEEKLDRHQEAVSTEWNALLSDVDRENARRKVEGEKLAGVVDAAGGKPVDAQVQEMMEEVAKNRVRGMLRGWIQTETGALKSHLGLVGSQAAAVDQLVADIMKEEEEKIAKDDPENIIGWRGDVMQDAREKLKERIDPMLTGEQKLRARDWFKANDWGRAWRESQKNKEEGK